MDKSTANARLFQQLDFARRCRTGIVAAAAAGRVTTPNGSANGGRRRRRRRAVGQEIFGRSPVNFGRRKRTGRRRGTGTGDGRVGL